MKRFKYIIILFLTVFLLTGCEETTQNNAEPNQPISKIETSEGKVSTAKMTQLYCKREGTASGGIAVNMHYDVFYTGDRLNIIHSYEQVISTDEKNLDIYENAYKGIHAHYEGLEYYDTSVVRGDTSVTSEMTINYDKIDVKKLLEIEGEEDNIFENNIPKFSKWMALAKKLGVTCEEVEK